MELRTFISKALLDIVGGVTDAQEQIQPGIIVPNIPDTKLSVDQGISRLQSVEFEVSVRIDEAKGSEGRIGVVNSFIGAGMAGKSSKESGHSSVLRFAVPLKLPLPKKKYDG